MSVESRKSKTTRSGLKKAGLRTPVLLIIIVAGLLVAAAALIYRAAFANPFAAVDGPPKLLVLLRNEQEGVYRVRYTGQGPTEIKSFVVQIQAQSVLHADPVSVVLSKDGQEIEVQEGGALPEGETLPLEPGDEFEVKITFRGETLGGNYLYGFRIGYGTELVRDYTLLMNQNYAIIVE